MIISYKNRPSTDSEFLFRSLGSFWTQLFRDKEVLKGYTLSQAQEMVQRYTDLVEIVSSYSVDDIPALHKEHWKPIQIFKSKLNKVPFIFEKGKAIFGTQPSNDIYYNDLIFKFGVDKQASEKVFQYFIGTEHKKFGVISDRILAPNELYTYGVDAVVNDGTLTINKNVFDSEFIEKFDVVGENGEAVTYIDDDGNVQEEQSAILWLYNAELDQGNLYKNFGYLFNLKLSNHEVYKEVLKVLFSLFVNGPTVQNIKTLCGAILGLPLVRNSSETIEDVFEDANYKYLVTDKEVYKTSLTATFKTSRVGDVINVGELITDDIDFFDNSYSVEGWWKKSNLIPEKLAFSRYLFLGSYIGQLSFSNKLENVFLDQLGNIVFPVIGHEDDIVRFNQFINSSNARKTKLKTFFNLVNPGDTTIFIPLDFIMDNFMKLNIAYIGLSFKSMEEMGYFLSLVPLIKNAVPPYIYLVLKFDIELPTEQFAKLNSNDVLIDSGLNAPSPGPDTDIFWMLNADVTDVDGYIEITAGETGYTNLNERLFEIGRALPTQPYEFVTTPDSIISEVESAGRLMVVKSGELLYDIPENATTAVYNKLLFLDFA